jgi:hypothetical protein
MKNRIARQAVRLFRNEGHSVDIAEPKLNVQGRLPGCDVLRGVPEKYASIVQRPASRFNARAASTR